MENQNTKGSLTYTPIATKEQMEKLIRIQAGKDGALSLSHKDGVMVRNYAVSVDKDVTEIRMEYASSKAIRTYKNMDEFTKHMERLIINMGDLYMVTGYEEQNNGI